MKLPFRPIYTLVAILCIAFSSLLFTSCEQARASTSAAAAVEKTSPTIYRQTETVRAVQHASLESLTAPREVDRSSVQTAVLRLTEPDPIEIKVLLADQYLPPDYGNYGNIPTNAPDLAKHDGNIAVGTRAREKV